MLFRFKVIIRLRLKINYTLKAILKRCVLSLVLNWYFDGNCIFPIFVCFCLHTHFFLSFSHSFHLARFHAINILLGFFA